jgi:2'-5' RNA ligase
MTTVGILLVIPEPYGGELQVRRAAYGDPAVSGVPAHVTLLPPTEVEPAELAGIERHLTEVAADHRPFSMRLRGTGTFRPVSQVVFVQVTDGTPECVALEAQVRSGALARELQFPYYPHVTLAHDLDEPTLDAAYRDFAEYEAAFELGGFGLYQQRKDGDWKVRRVFSFDRQKRLARQTKLAA